MRDLIERAVGMVVVSAVMMGFVVFIVKLVESQL